MEHSLAFYLFLFDVIFFCSGDGPLHGRQNYFRSLSSALHLYNSFRPGAGADCSNLHIKVGR